MRDIIDLRRVKIAGNSFFLFFCCPSCVSILVLLVLYQNRCNWHQKTESNYVLPNLFVIDMHSATYGEKIFNLALWCLNTNLLWFQDCVQYTKNNFLVKAKTIIRRHVWFYSVLTNSCTAIHKHGLLLLIYCLGSRGQGYAVQFDKLHTEWLCWFGQQARSAYNSQVCAVLQCHVNCGLKGPSI